MSDRVPDVLLTALTPDERAGLKRVLDTVGLELNQLYADEVADHRESRGDNGQLFGMKLWVHGWYRYEDLFADDPLVRVVPENGSWALRVGRLRIGIYRQGSDIDDDVHHDIPHADSETKRSYGVNNAAQLALFDGSIGRPSLDDARLAALFDLTITHFGNSRDAMVKWYLGAQSEPGRWAWVIRQPDIASVSKADATLSPIRRVDPGAPGGRVVPFNQRPVRDIDVVARRPSATDQQSEDRE